jgi:hypothetical protein
MKQITQVHHQNFVFISPRAAAAAAASEAENKAKGENSLVSWLEIINQML